MKMSACRFVVALALIISAGHAAPLAREPHRVVPDFSGHWRFDSTKSVRLARTSGGNTASGIFGDDCTITQTDDMLTMDIVAGPLKVQAVYRLDGTPSENRSPGPAGQPDILVVTTARWVNASLHLTTKSESDIGGAKVRVESLKKIWLTAEGDLAIDRHGTPAEIIPDAWSVYGRVK